MRCFALAVVLSVTMDADAAPQHVDDSALATFRAAVEEYLNVHRRLEAEVPALVVTAESREISEGSDVLAMAITRSRPKARAGDLFNPGVAKVIMVRVRQALRGVDPNAFLIAINDEPTLKGPPRIHLRFPAASSMATMPTQVLDVLPPLPPELEYRFLGRALILRDRDAALIVDFIPEALPRR